MGKKFKLMKKKLTSYIRSSLIKGKKLKITGSTLLFKNNLIDSMNILYLIGFVEKKMGRRLTDKEINMKNFKSINSIIKSFFDAK